MGADRYVILALGRPRAEWFAAVGRWATSAAIPAEYLKCVSAEEVRTRLTGERPVSALLLDGGIAAADRDLVHLARDAGCAVLVVDDVAGRDWRGLGAAAVLPPGFTREALLDVLAAHAQMVGRARAMEVEQGDIPVDVSDGLGPLVTVCGPGGAGASTLAAALAQGLAERAPAGGDVVLADLALDAEQAVLHDVRDLVPGVQELVEAHRVRRPGPDEVRALTFAVVERRYHLLLGLRRARYWSTIRPRSWEAAFGSLRRAFGTVVCDVAADFEGEADAGSADVEERNLLARSAALAADAVVVVGRPGVKGVHSLVRVLGDLVALGVAPARVVPVLNLAPRAPRARAELASTVAQLAAPSTGGARLAPPVFVPARRVEEALRDAVPLPGPLPSLMAGAVDAVLARVGSSAFAGRPPVVPVPVLPGTLGVHGRSAGRHDGRREDGAA